MTTEEAIRDIAIATGLPPFYVRAGVAALNTYNKDADEIIETLKALAQSKRPITPYAKLYMSHIKKEK